MLETDIHSCIQHDAYIMAMRSWLLDNMGFDVASDTCNNKLRQHSMETWQIRIDGTHTVVQCSLKDVPFRQLAIYRMSFVCSISWREKFLSRFRSARAMWMCARKFECDAALYFFPCDVSIRVRHPGTVIIALQCLAISKRNFLWQFILITSI